MQIDNIAYYSNLRNINPSIKAIFAFATLVICVWANSYIVSIFVLISMFLLITKVAGVRTKVLVRLLILPISFIILGSIAILIDISSNKDNMLVAISIGDRLVGVGRESVYIFIRLFLKCMGAISCMYFLSLTTPMIELFSMLKKSIIPNFIVELMELIYRYIFVLYIVAHRIYIAQSCRLGYYTFKISFKSLGGLVANLFLRAYKQADRTYTALEARGYTGDINTIEIEYYNNKPYVYFSLGYIAIIIVLASICCSFGI